MILQLCRTGHDNISRTRVTTLGFIYMLMVLDAISCPLYNLNTLWYIIMILYRLLQSGNDDELHTRMTTLTFIVVHYLPLIDRVTISRPLSILNTVRNIFMRLYGSLEEVVAMFYE